MFCPKCGSRVSDDAKFCPKCGQKLSPRQPALAAAPASSASAPVGGQAAPGAPATQAAPAKRTPVVLIAVAALAAAILALVVVRFVACGGVGASISHDQQINAESTNASCVLEGDALVHATAGGAVVSSPLDGGGSTKLFEPDGSAYGLDLSLHKVGDRYIYVCVSDSDDATVEVHAVDKDGGNDETIYSVDSSGDGYVYLSKLSVWKDRIYLALVQSDSDSSEVRVGVVSFEADGSDRKAELGVGADNAYVYQTVFNDDELYIVGSKDNTECIWRVDIRGDGDPQRIYRAKDGEVVSAGGPLFADGRMYFATVDADDYGHADWMSAKPDGSDLRKAEEAELKQIGEPNGTYFDAMTVGSVGRGRKLYFGYSGDNGYYYVADDDGGNKTRLDS